MTKMDTPRTLPVEIRAADDTGFTFTGLGVPYGQEIDLWGAREKFAPGSVTLDPDGVPSLIRWEHAETIGKIESGRDTPDGFEITGRISDTPRGREAATLLRDGVITRLSIGFTPDEYTVTPADDGRDLITHTSVRALEFSLVSFPAYSSAEITTVRHRTTTEGNQTMPDTLTRDDLDAAINPLGDDVTDLKRSLALLGDRIGDQSAPTGPAYRSIGDYLKHVAEGDERAVEFHRAITTGDTGIDTATPLGNFIKLVQDRRRLIDLFATGTLPADGMSVEYAQLVDNTTAAAEQTAQATDLTGPGAIKLETKSANVRTFGGYTTLSKQIIDRLSTAYLDTTLTALGIAYARATNAAMRAQITGAITDQTTAGDTLTLDPATATVHDWRSLIVDAAALYDDRGFNLAGLLVSTDDYKRLQALEYTGVPAFKVNPSDEFTGTLTLPNGSGDLASVAVNCVFGEYAGGPAFYDPQALKSLESPGAPLQLQDENIVNLTKSYSLYGYMAFISPFPSAIVPVVAAP